MKRNFQKKVIISRFALPCEGTTPAQKDFLLKIIELEQNHQVLIKTTQQTEATIDKTALQNEIQFHFTSLENMQNLAERLFANDFFVLYNVYCYKYIFDDATYKTTIDIFESLSKLLLDSIEDIDQLDNNQLSLVISFLSEVTSAMFTIYKDYRTQKTPISVNIIKDSVSILVAYDRLWPKLKDTPAAHIKDIVKYTTIGEKLLASTKDHNSNKLVNTHFASFVTGQNFSVWFTSFTRESIIAITAFAVDLPIINSAIVSPLGPATYRLFLAGISFLIGQTLQDQPDHPRQTEALLANPFAFLLNGSPNEKIAFYRAIAFWADTNNQENTLIFWLQKYQDKYASNFKEDTIIGDIILDALKTNAGKRMQLQAYLGDGYIPENLLPATRVIFATLTIDTEEKIRALLASNNSSYRPDTLENLTTLFLCFQKFPALIQKHPLIIVNIYFSLSLVSKKEHFTLLNKLFFNKATKDSYLENFYVFWIQATKDLSIAFDTNIESFANIIDGLRLSLIYHLHTSLGTISFSGEKACNLENSDNLFDTLGDIMTRIISAWCKGDPQKGLGELDSLISAYDQNPIVKYALLKAKIIITRNLDAGKHEKKDEIYDMSIALQEIEPNLFENDYQMRIILLSYSPTTESVPMLCSLLQEGVSIKNKFHDHSFWLMEPSNYRNGTKKLWTYFQKTPSLYHKDMLNVLDLYLEQEQSLEYFLFGIIVAMHLATESENVDNGALSDKIDDYIKQLKPFLQSNDKALQQLTTIKPRLEAIQFEDKTNYAYTLLADALYDHLQTPHILELLLTIDPAAVEIWDIVPHFLDRTFYPTNEQPQIADVLALKRLIKTATKKHANQELSHWDHFQIKALRLILEVYVEAATPSPKNAVQTPPKGKKKKKKKKKKKAVPNNNLNPISLLIPLAKGSSISKQDPILQMLKQSQGKNILFSGQAGVIASLTQYFVEQRTTQIIAQHPSLDPGSIEDLGLVFQPSSVVEAEVSLRQRFMATTRNIFDMIFQKKPVEVVSMFNQGDISETDMARLLAQEQAKNNIMRFILEKLHLRSILLENTIVQLFKESSLLDMNKPGGNFAGFINAFTNMEHQKSQKMLEIAARPQEHKDKVIISKSLVTKRLYIKDTAASMLIAQLLAEGYIFQLPMSPPRNHVYHVTNETDQAFGTEIEEFDFRLVPNAFKVAINILLETALDDLNNLKKSQYLQKILALLFEAIATEQEIEDEIMESFP